MAFIGKGAVLQVQQMVKRGTLSGTAGVGSFVAFDSTFRVQITPQYSSSLILVGGYLTAACSGGSQGLKVIYRRNDSTLGTAMNGTGTEQLTGNPYSNVTAATTNAVIDNHGAENFTLCYIDKPNTTSQCSYSVALGTTSGASRTVYINIINGENNNSQWSRFSSVLYAMEIAQ